MALDRINNAVRVWIEDILEPARMIEEGVIRMVVGDDQEAFEILLIPEMAKELIAQLQAACDQESAIEG